MEVYIIKKKFHMLYYKDTKERYTAAASTRKSEGQKKTPFFSEDQRRGSKLSVFPFVEVPERSLKVWGYIGFLIRAANGAHRFFDSTAPACPRNEKPMPNRRLPPPQRR